MRNERLYDLAFEFKNTKMWKKMWEANMFAVRFSDGETGYCCISGMMGEGPALTVHVGPAGLNCLQATQSMPKHLFEWERDELDVLVSGVRCAFLSKDSLLDRNREEVLAYVKAKGMKMRGANAYPHFEALRPGCLPWYADEKQLGYIEEGLCAALEVQRRGLVPPKGMPWEREIPLLRKKGSGYVLEEISLPAFEGLFVPSPRESDELLVARCRKQKGAEQWNCVLMQHPVPFADGKNGPGSEPKNAPQFPHVLLIVNDADGKLVKILMAYDLIRDAGMLVRGLLQEMEKNGKPRKIAAGDARTVKLLETVCGQVGVKLEQELPDNLYFAMRDYYVRFGGLTEEEPQKESELEIQATINRLVSERPDMLKEMPDELIKEFAHGVIENPLSKQVSLLVLEEWKKRFLK